MDLEKSIKNAKLISAFLLVWFIIKRFLVIYMVSAGGFFTFQNLAIPTSLEIILSTILPVILLVSTIKGLHDKKKYGAICGIIVSVILILNFNVINIILGILYLIDCIRILNVMSSNNVK